MVKNRGTLEGDAQEKEFVMNFNSNKSAPIFKYYVSNFIKYDIDQIFMVRVTTNQFSELSSQVVKTRADAYLIYSTDITISNVLSYNNYYLDEYILQSKNIKYSIIKYSGLSIKLNDSFKYQILKLTPNSFKTLFGNLELGAGACLFCNKELELSKNAALIKGWLSTREKMEMYFLQIINGDANFYLNKGICKKIKSYSEEQIKNIIDSSEELQKKIFNGIYLYKEPYTAYYFAHDNKLVDLTYIPFNITTGSGRSHGNYTLVLKPM